MVLHEGLINKLTEQNKKLKEWIKAKKAQKYNSKGNLREIKGLIKRHFEKDQDKSIFDRVSTHADDNASARKSTRSDHKPKQSSKRDSKESRSPVSRSRSGV